MWILGSGYQKNSKRIYIERDFLFAGKFNFIKARLLF